MTIKPSEDLYHKVSVFNTAVYKQHSFLGLTSLFDGILRSFYDFYYGRPL